VYTPRPYTARTTTNDLHDFGRPRNQCIQQPVVLRLHPLYILHVLRRSLNVRADDCSRGGGCRVGGGTRARRATSTGRGRGGGRTLPPPVSINRIDLRQAPVGQRRQSRPPLVVSRFRPSSSSSCRDRPPSSIDSCGLSLAAEKRRARFVISRRSGRRSTALPYAAHSHSHFKIIRAIRGSVSNRCARPAFSISLSRTLPTPPFCGYSSASRPTSFVAGREATTTDRGRQRDAGARPARPAAITTTTRHGRRPLAARARDVVSARAAAAAR